MRLPSPGLMVFLVAAAVGVFFGYRALSDKSEETSDAIVSGITTPIDRATRVQVESEVRAGLAAALLYFAENGSYEGISALRLRRIDQGLSPVLQVLPEGTTFCVMSIGPRVSLHAVGPTGEITDGPCTGAG
jgi:hypothetical protein